MEINDDTPLRLADALALAFPNGGMTVSGLRREAKRGRLRIERIANKDFTTLWDIREMREQCRVRADLAHGSVRGRQDRGQDEPALSEFAVRDAAIRRLRELRQGTSEKGELSPQEALRIRLEKDQRELRQGTSEERKDYTIRDAVQRRLEEQRRKVSEPERGFNARDALLARIKARRGK